MAANSRFPRGKKILDYFQEHDFLRDLKNLPFSSLLRSTEKRAGISNPVKDSVFESFFNIFFTLACYVVNWIPFLGMHCSFVAKKGLNLTRLRYKLTRFSSSFFLKLVLKVESPVGHLLA